jgi:nucleoside-diphosphate-sugar epimerase
MKILVTGASGFIGAALCDEARSLGWDVWEVRRRRPETSSINYVKADLLYDNDLSAALHGVDCVVHLAARVHQMDRSSLKNRDAYWQLNVEASKRLIEQSAAAGVRRFVFLSSAKVNGEYSFGRALTEDDAPAPKGAYARSKLEAEQVLRTCAEALGMEWVVVRPSLVYGPSVKGNFLRLMSFILTGIPLPCAKVCRSYVSVWSLVELILLCCRHPLAANQLFLAGDVVWTTEELVLRLGSAMGKRVLRVPIPRCIARPLSFLGQTFARLFGEFEICSQKARTLLGWQPRVAPEEALRRTATYFVTTKASR